MNKTYRIVQYIQPWEIDRLERQINQMLLSSYHINNKKNIIWDVTMNLDIVNWQSSKMPKQYFIDKFNYLQLLVDHYYTAEFDFDTVIQGAGDKKRHCANKSQDFSIWLDSDIYFSYYTLPFLIHATENISDDTFILTPEIIKYWDSSWDCITHDKFIHEPFNCRDTFDLYCLDTLVSNNNVHLETIQRSKFGAGWFTLISDKLSKTIKIPIELGPYGPDDTYIMICADFLKIPQYVLRGVVVSEIGLKYDTGSNYIKPMLDVKISDKEKITDVQLHELVHKFINSKTKL